MQVELKRYVRDTSLCIICVLDAWEIICYRFIAATVDYTTRHRICVSMSVFGECRRCYRRLGRKVAV